VEVSAKSNGSVAGLRNPRARQRALAIGALPQGSADDDPLAELKELLRTAGVATTGEVVQMRAEPDPDRYLGRGKLSEVKDAIKASGANLVACDDELAPRQERNLEAALDVPVIDRTAVILDIFADHAHSAEGKLQVELAQLEYNLARMRGLWTHLERLGAGRMDGGIGTRGPGESQIETDRRLGKSTLLNALTGAGVSVGSRLFHTLDPTTRVYEHSGRRYLVTDTVGFIRKLPHQLVEAFKATLEETRLADLIVHVVDASEPDEQRAGSIAAVDAVLEEMHAGDRPRLLVFNKMDLLTDEERRRILVGRRDAVGISAETGEGLEELRDRIAEEFERTLEPMELLVPYAEGSRLAELYEIAGDLEREESPEGVRVSVKVPKSLAHRFEVFSVNGR
jgi:GTP-binding protein HflX